MRISIPVRFRQFMASFLLFATLFTQGQPAYCNDITMDELYRNKASVEMQSYYDQAIRDILPQAKISLSSAYTLKARFEDRIKSNSMASPIETQEDIKLLKDIISEVESKNDTTSTLIKNVYHYLGLCFTWGKMIPLIHKDFYPYSIVEEPSLSPDEIDFLGIYAKVEGKKQKRSFILSELFEGFILSEDELKDKNEKIYEESQDKFFRLSPKVDLLLNMSQKLNSILFRHAKAEAVKLKFEGLFSPERNNTNLLFEGIIQLEAPRSLMNLPKNKLGFGKNQVEITTDVVSMGYYISPQVISTSKNLFSDFFSYQPEFATDFFEKASSKDGKINIQILFMPAKKGMDPRLESTVSIQIPTKMVKSLKKYTDDF
jgi:hypothetical protein